MNRLFFSFDFITTIITGAALTATLVTTQAMILVAKSSTEIATIAQATTVKIENTAGLPGGSGVIISRHHNIYTVLTANHVVQSPNIDYIIQLQSENQDRQYPVSGVHSLQEKTGLDLALVTFESQQSYSVATFGNFQYIRAGSKAFVSGYPLTVAPSNNREHEFTQGIVTSIREDASDGYEMRYDALTRRGMSGGPVFNHSGQLIGIHGQGDVIGSFKNESSNIPEPLKTGFNAAIPINKFLDSLPLAEISNSDLRLAKGKPERVDSEAMEKYLEGIELLERGDVERANDYLIEAASQNPHNALAFYYQGLIDYTKRDLNSAISNYNLAIQVNRNFSLAYFSRGLAHYRLGKKQRALADYDSALRINPVDPWSYLNRGLVREDLNDIPGALSDYNQAIKIDPNYGYSYYNRGVILYSQKHYQAAIQDFQHAADIFFQKGDTQSYNVAIDSLNKAQSALRNTPERQQNPTRPEIVPARP